MLSSERERVHPAPLRLNPVHVIATGDGIAYLNTRDVCGRDGIAVVWRDSPVSLQVAYVVDEARLGYVTNGGGCSDESGVIPEIRRGTTSDRPRDEVANLHVLLSCYPRRLGAAYVRNHRGLPRRDVHAALAREAISKAAIPEAMRDALTACIDHGMPETVARMAGFRRDVGCIGWEGLAFAARNPALCEAATSDESVNLLAHADPMEALRRRWPGLGEAHLRRFRGISGADLVQLTERSAQTKAAVLDVLHAVPHDWWPRLGEWADLCFVADVVRNVDITTRSGPRTLLEASKGRWGTYAERLRQLSGLGPVKLQGAHDKAACRLAYHTRDLTISFCLEILYPLIAHVGRERIPDYEGAAARLIYGGKSVVGVLETSAEWHARVRTISAGVRSGEGNESWPPLFEHPYRHGDVTIVAIATRDSLAAEGGFGKDADGIDGLHHCVPSRLPRLLDGSAHMLSIRLTLPDGSVRRLSTCEVRASPKEGTALRIMPTEHRGHGNGVVPGKAADALAALVTDAAEGSVKVNPDALAPKPEVTKANRIRQACGYDWSDPDAMATAIRAWEPLLPRWARGHDPLAFYEALLAQGIVPPVEPEEWDELPGP